MIVAWLFRAMSARTPVAWLFRVMRGDAVTTGLKTRATYLYFDPFFGGISGRGRAASVTALIFEA